MPVPMRGQPLVNPEANDVSSQKISSMKLLSLLLNQKRRDVWGLKSLFIVYSLRSLRILYEEP
jgi:hypothetical protein